MAAVFLSIHMNGHLAKLENSPQTLDFLAAVTDNKSVYAIKNSTLAGLFMETRFAPARQQLKQLAAAERLFWATEPERDYPFEFVCFQITGYRPKEAGATELINGSELLEDLPVFIVKLGGRLKLKASSQQESIYTIDQLAEKFSVSAKTINRWRKRGFPAGKYIFDDGKTRLGFTESAVSKFVDRNSELVEKASNFSQLAATEKDKIIQTAMELAQDNQLSRRRIIKSIAQRLGRADETVRYTLAEYEKENCNKPIFKNRGDTITPKDTAVIYNTFKSGTDAKELTKKFHRSKSSVYRIINQQRIRGLLSIHLEFIDSAEFFAPDAKEKFLGSKLNISRTLTLEKIPFGRPAPNFWPQYLDALKTIEPMSRDLEIELFARYNYLKYLAGIMRTKLDLTRPVSSLINEVEGYLAEAEQIKNMIIESNLRLVVTIANRHIAAGNPQDLVSEGNLALMRAVEKYDYTRGVRFGTYASWVIATDFARSIPAETKRPDKSGHAKLANVQQDMRKIAAPGIEILETAHRSLEQVIKNNLTEREQYIVRYHFGLVGPTVKKKSKTLKQIGEELGLTKERVRQIELGALQKLRHSLSPEEFELLTG